MKATSTVLAALLFICIGSGCKKETPSTTPNSGSKNNCRVASVTEQNFLISETTTKSYQYDGEGRVIKESYPNGYYTIFSYEGNKLIIRQYNVADQQINSDPRDECYINSNGYIVKRVRYHTGSHYFNTSEYTYSPDGYMIEAKYTDEDKRVDITTFTIENGNTVKEKNKDGSLIITYTYLADENKAGIHQGFVSTDADALARFYGKPNKNLVNTYTIGSDAAKYFYNMEDGLPKYSKLVSGSGNKMYEVFYSFDCK